MLEGGVVGAAAGEEVGEEVEDLFFVQGVEQAGGHEGEGGGLAGLDGGPRDLLHLRGSRAGLEGHGGFAFGEPADWFSGGERIGWGGRGELRLGWLLTRAYAAGTGD